MSNHIAYLRRYRDPHGSLSVLGPACRRAGNVQLVRVPMHALQAGGSGVLGRANLWFGKLLGHLRLIPKAFSSGGRTLLVREFLTVPLFLIAPAIWLRRKSLWFMCQHNVGLAAKRPLHRWMLAVLERVGFRFVVGESLEGWRPVSSQPGPTSVVAMPWPMPDVMRRGPARDPATQTVVVGFVGNFRAEKSPRWALDEVQRAREAGRFVPPIQLLVGTADKAFLAQWSERAVVIDTTTREDYLRALESCDVVVLPYDESSYSYRTSGVLGEAVAMGCMVVTPDLPVLRDQVMQPVPVGVCYASRADLVDCVEQAVALAKLPGRAAAIEAHRAYRSLDAMTRAIRQMAAS